MRRGLLLGPLLALAACDDAEPVTVMVTIVEAPGLKERRTISGISEGTQYRTGPATSETLHGGRGRRAVMVQLSSTQVGPVLVELLWPYSGGPGRIRYTYDFNPSRVVIVEAPAQARFVDGWTRFEANFESSEGRVEFTASVRSHASGTTTYSPPPRSTQTSVSVGYVAVHHDDYGCGGPADPEPRTPSSYGSPSEEPGCSGDDVDVDDDYGCGGDDVESDGCDGDTVASLEPRRRPALARSLARFGPFVFVGLLNRSARYRRRR